MENLGNDDKRVKDGAWNEDNRRKERQMAVVRLSVAWLLITFPPAFSAVAFMPGSGKGLGGRTGGDEGRISLSHECKT